MAAPATIKAPRTSVKVSVMVSHPPTECRLLWIKKKTQAQPEFFGFFFKLLQMIRRLYDNENCVIQVIYLELNHADECTMMSFFVFFCFTGCTRESRGSDLRCLPLISNASFTTWQLWRSATPEDTTVSSPPTASPTADILGFEMLCTLFDSVFFSGLALCCPSDYVC